MSNRVTLNIFRQATASKDDKFLSVAVSENESLIFTGDNDVLAIHPFLGVKVVSPSAYLKRPR